MIETRAFYGISAFLSGTMNSFLRELFAVNQPLVFFVYGLVFFVLGLAITLQSRRHSRLILARRLH